MTTEQIIGAVLMVAGSILLFAGTDWAISWHEQRRHPSPPGVPTASQAQALTPLAAVGVAGVALVIAGVLLAF